MAASKGADKIINKIYLPFVSGNTEKLLFGIAFSNYACENDLDLLQVDWYYNWSTKGVKSSKEFVPMLWSGDISEDIPQDYSGYVLCFNEPNVTIQLNIAPEEMVKRYLVLKNYYTKAKLIIGGWSIWAYYHYDKFLSLLDKKDYPTTIHIHTYIEEYITPDWVESGLNRFYTRNPCEFWVSEFNEVRGNLKDFEAIIKLLKSKEYIKRIAVYTNRQNGEWWNLPNSTLVENDVLNDKGNIFLTQR